MFCNNCGKELKEGALFCNECGAKTKNAQATNEPINEPVIENQPMVETQPIQAEPTVKAEGIGFGQAYRLFFKNYFNFKGRATRSEFWWVFIFNLLLTYVINLIPVMGALLSLGIIIPGIALSVRRLHDTGKSWVYLLISLIPIVGAILLIVQYCKDSDGDNKWGPATK